MAILPAQQKPRLWPPALEASGEAEDRRIGLLLSLAVVGAIAAVAYADFVVVSISLGYLYVLPLALSALVHRLRTSLFLVVICVVLHDWFGPFVHSGWQHPTMIFLTFLGFSTAVIVVNQIGQQRREFYEIARAQRDEMARDMELAAEVQQRLLPQQPPRRRGLDIAGQMYPTKLVGGDYYDYLELPDGALGLVIADVSGKGAAGALLMPSVQLGLHLVTRNSSSPGGTLQELNRILCDIMSEGRYVTVLYAKLDPVQSRLEYCNGGHFPPLLLPSAGAEPVWLETGGPVLGLLPEANYESASVTLRPGGLLVFYTDGVIEAENAGEEAYSRQRLLSVVRSHRTGSAAEIVRAIYESVLAFRGSASLEDDLTLIVVKATQP